MNLNRIKGIGQKLVDLRPSFLLGMGLTLIIPTIAYSEPGEGVRVAGAKIVPSVDVYTRYETNPGRLAEDEGPQGDASVTSRIGVDFRRAGADLALDASGSLLYDHYFGTSDEATKNYSAFSGDLSLDVETNRRGEFPIDIRLNLLRSSDPQIGTLNRKLEHTMLGATVDAGYNPGGGALKNTATAGFTYDLFDRGTTEATEAAAKRQDYARFNVGIESLYKFLPKTGAFLKANWSQQTFTHNDIAFEFTNSSDGTVYTGNNQNIGIGNVLGGLTGMLTPKMTVLVSAGAVLTSLGTSAINANCASGTSGANCNGTTDEGVTGLAGNFQLNWQNSSTAKTFVQLSRTVAPASLFKYVDIISGAIGGELRILGDLALSAKVSSAYLDYGVPVVSGVSGRTDIKVDADFVASYSINAGLVFALVNQLELMATSFQSPNGLNPSYTSNATFLRVAFRY